MSQVGFNPSLDSATRAGGTNRFQEMTTEDFVKIIFTELSSQDPFQPNDSGALLEQLNSIRSIESDIQLTDQLQSLVTQNQLASAGNLVGKFIGGLTSDAQRVAGYVVGVSRIGDQVNLELDNNWVVPMSNLEMILDPALVEEESA
jgi:flagellar basal-body rod modification protein FlgD